MIRFVDPARWPARWDLAALAAEWRAARPFPHLVLDDFLDEDGLSALRQGVAGEPHWPHRSEIVECMASAAQVQGPNLRAFAAQLGGEDTRRALAAITGTPTSCVEVRSYVYLAGSYLLPHSDHRAGIDRRLAFVLYLSQPEGWHGGELDLYRCHFEGGEITGTTVETTIEPRPNRLALLQVSEASLHRVREVTFGARVSLAGWFL